jgi:hypothetical protein
MGPLIAFWDPGAEQGGEDLPLVQSPTTIVDRRAEVAVDDDRIGVLLDALMVSNWPSALGDNA